MYYHLLCIIEKTTENYENKMKLRHKSYIFFFRCVCISEIKK